MAHRGQRVNESTAQHLHKRKLFSKREQSTYEGRRLPGNLRIQVDGVVAPVRDRSTSRASAQRESERHGSCIRDQRAHFGVAPGGGCTRVATPVRRVHVRLDVTLGRAHARPA